MKDFQRLIKMSEEGDEKASRELHREMERRGVLKPYQKISLQLETRPPKAMKNMEDIQYRLQYFIGMYELRMGYPGLIDRQEILTWQDGVYTYTLTGRASPDLACTLENLLVNMNKEQRKRESQGRRPWYLRVLDATSRFLR